MQWEPSVGTYPTFLLQKPSRQDAVLRLTRGNETTDEKSSAGTIDILVG